MGLVEWTKTRGAKEVGFVCPSRKGKMHQERKLGRKGGHGRCNRQDSGVRTNTSGVTPGWYKE